MSRPIVRVEVEYTWLRWCNKWLLGLVALGVVVITAHVVGSMVAQAAQGPDCWECPFPTVAHAMSVYFLGGALLFWMPFVFYAGAWPTPMNARALAVVQLVAAVLAGFLATAAAPLYPWWAAVLNLTWLVAAAAHAMAVLFVPSRFWSAAHAPQ